MGSTHCQGPPLQVNFLLQSAHPIPLDLTRPYSKPITKPIVEMLVCRRSLLLRRNVSLLPPRILNDDLRMFLLPRFQSTAPSSIQSALTNAINAPTATLPAPLELPKRDSGMNTFMYLLKTGKGYVCSSISVKFPFIWNGISTDVDSYRFTKPA